MTLTERLAAWAAGLAFDDVPPRVVAYAKSQVLSQLGAARATRSHPLGPAIVQALGDPASAPDPKQAACALAALTMALDFDDTVYAGHVSHSAVAVPLAYARPLGLDGRDLLAAVVAADECAARVTAAATIGPFRGQTAAHTHLAGGVAARLRAEAAPADRWVSAWGIAFAAPPWPLTRAFLGSDAKVLTASVPLRVALDACDAAAAGLSGAADILEHPDGFLARFSDVPLPDAAVADLGRRWHTETLSFKVYPACAYLDAVLDCAVELHHALTPADLATVAEVVVHASIFTVAMDVRSAPYVCGPRSPVSALTFSVAYSVATALLTGGLAPGDLAPAALDEARRWDLAGRVRLELDDALTHRALTATAPIGEALRQAGDRAAPWLRSAGGERAEALLRELGPPSPGFDHADKAIGARVEVRLADGRVLRSERDVPLGAAGPETREHHPALTRQKFLACGGEPEVADALARLDELGPADVAATLAAALAG